MASSLLEVSLLEWLGKFNNNSLSCASLSDLYDGILVNSFINQYFCDEGTLEVPSSAKEWLLMKEFWLSVLTQLARFVVKSMGSQYATVEEQMDALVNEVDVEALARLSDESAVLALLEVLLACSMHCKLKENCVFQVLQLRKDQQQVMMESIQRFKGKHLKIRASSSGSTAPAPSAHNDYKDRYIQLKQSKDQLQTQLQSTQKTNGILSERNGELATLVTQLEAQLASVTADYKSTRQELDTVAEKQQTAKSDEVDLSSPMRFVASSKVASEENNQLRLTIGTHEKTITSLQNKLSSLSPYVSRVRELEDEVEMLKEKSRSADQLERVTRKLEAKTTELVNSMNRSKLLEVQVDTLTKTAAEHESVAKQVPQLKAKLEQYKTELVALHSKITDASARDVQSTDSKALTDKLQAVTIQLEHQTSIIASLEREKEELVSALRTRPVVAPGHGILPSKPSLGQLNATSSVAGNQKMSLAAETQHTLQFQNRGGRGREALDQLEKELSSTKEEKESLRLDLEDKLDTMGRLKEKFQGDYVSTVEQLREVQVTLASTAEQWRVSQSELVEVRAALEVQRVALEKSEISFSSLSGECDGLKRECARLKVDCEQWKSQAKEEEGRVSAQIAIWKADLEEAHSRLEVVSGELSAQQDVAQGLISDLDEVRHDKAQLAGAMANLELESASLEETLKTFMDRELTVVERSHALENELLNMRAVVESRDAELTLMQSELERARLNDELVAVITALRAQLLAQNKQMAHHKEELRAIVTSYHKLGLELLHYKIGGLPQPAPLIAQSAAPQPLKITTTGWGITKDAQRGTPTKRIPLKDKSNLPLGQIPSGVCTETNHKTRRMTMAQRALESRPRGSLAAISLAKR